jgi:hypothetical protein
MSIVEHLDKDDRQVLEALKQSLDTSELEVLRKGIRLLGMTLQLNGGIKMNFPPEVTRHKKVNLDG